MVFISPPYPSVFFYYNCNKRGSQCIKYRFFCTNDGFYASINLFRLWGKQLTSQKKFAIILYGTALLSKEGKGKTCGRPFLDLFLSGRKWKPFYVCLTFLQEKSKIMKRILLIATGGTIVSRLGKNGLTPQIRAEELLHYVPDTIRFCEVTALQLMNLDSTNMCPRDWEIVARAVRENYERYDGFVICHGTDTLAFTAAVLSYMIQNSPKPIVLTGSQKPIDLEITDARTNLSDSLLYASDDGSSGVVIVFDGKVIAGTRAKKTRTKSYNAFSSINYPCLAVIREGKILRYQTEKEKGGPLFFESLDSRVGVFKLIPGMPSDILDYYFKLFDAVIIESFGAGGIPDAPYYHFTEIIERWQGQGKILVMCTQVTNEGSDMGVYEVGKGAKNKFGFLETYDMTLEAAVTKLMWILSLTRDPEKVKKLFYTPVDHDILYPAL